MNKKVVFVDVDGTIIAKKRGLMVPSEKTQYAFKELKKNHYVFLCSGRSAATFPLSVVALEKSGFIGSNGQYVVFEDKEIYNKKIDKELVKKMYEFLKLHHGALLRVDGDKAYQVNYGNKNFPTFLKNFFDDTRFSEEELNYESTLLMPVFEEEDLEEEMNEFLEHKLDVRIHPSKTSYDANTPGESKGNSIQKVLDYLKMSSEDAYCFGDEINDMEMMQAVKHSVCMGSGNDEVKKIAETVCEDVLDDGFYWQLVRFGLIKPMQ